MPEQRHLWGPANGVGIPQIPAVDRRFTPASLLHSPCHHNSREQLITWSRFCLWRFASLRTATPFILPDALALALALLSSGDGDEVSLVVSTVWGGR